MREVQFEKFGALHEAARVQAKEPGAGGAPTFYRIEIGGTDERPLYVHTVEFQDRNPADAITGPSNEILIAVLIDRMQGFQNGPGKCRENAIALTHLEEALLWLQKRTRERLSRGVEGTTAA